MVAPELELDSPRWSISMLCDVDFGDSGLLVRFVVLGPKKEHDNVGVLFDTIVNDCIARYKIVKVINGQVIDLFGAIWFDGTDFVPIDFAGCEQLDFAGSNSLGDPHCPRTAQVLTKE